MGILVGLLVQLEMQPVADHLKRHPDRSALQHLVHTVSNKFCLQGFATTTLLSVGGFMLMPFIFTHLSTSPMWALVTILVILQSAVFPRIISASTLMSALPEPRDRGAYMSISSSLQQVAGGIGSMMSGMLVYESTDGTLLHFDRVGYVLVGTTLLTLSMMFFINRKISARRGERNIVLGATALERIG